MAFLKNNLTGKEIGNLKVIRDYQTSYLGKDKNRKTLRKLECMCKCGVVFHPFKTNVMRGHTTQCMYCANSNFMPGEQVGNLKILERDLSRSRRFLCRCVCGHVTSIKTHYLKNGKAPIRCERCRYHKKYDTRVKLSRKEAQKINAFQQHLDSVEEKIGTTTNEIKVIKFSHWEKNETRRRPFFLCKCKCKKEFTCRGDHLKKVMSCGCTKDSAWGERNPRALLKNYEADAIREIKKTNNFTQREIAKMFGIPEHQVSDIILEKTYISYKNKKIKETACKK